MDDDRISSLPDEIISHILSFQRIREAVRTDVLSRRWKDLWTRVSNFDLENYQYYHHYYQSYYVEGGCMFEIRARRDLEFSRFVYKVLSEHKNLNSLKLFRLHFPAEYLDCEVRPNFWSKLELASDESQLEQIDVRISGQSCIHQPLRIHRFPEALYRLKRLKVLKLEGVIIAAAKGSVLLPSLKTLEVLKVDFKGCESLSSLLSGCPVLETLHLEKCFSRIKREITVVTACFSSLKNLRIVGSSSRAYLLCEINIDAPNLEQLYLHNLHGLQFLGTGSPLPCLHSAHVQLGRSQISKHALVRLLAQMSNAKVMWLSWQILSIWLEDDDDDDEDDDDDDDDVELPIFPNLTRLTIQLNGSGSCILHSLLNAASKLQYLGIELLNDLGAMEWEQATPKCLLSSLEVIRIEHLEAGHEEEVEMVAYFLKAGAVLKKVNVHVDYHDDHKKDRMDFVSLLRLPRGSRACEVHISLPHGNEFNVDSKYEFGSEDDFDGTDDDDEDAMMDDEIGTDDSSE